MSHGILYGFLRDSKQMQVRLRTQRGRLVTIDADLAEVATGSGGEFLQRDLNALIRNTVCAQAMGTQP